ncbi:MAG: NADH-quinone oxidoreductase subunit NuoH [Bdellovibrionota bacterium]
MDNLDWIVMGAKIALVVVVMLQVVPMMVWIERRGSALMQNRLGPNRVGPLGLLQSLADVIKFIMKEDFVPSHVEKFYFLLAPVAVLIPAFMTFAVVPFGGDITIGDRVYHLQITDLNVGLLYIFSIASLGVYGIIMAGWSSNNKYSLLGSLRSSAQMISYELALGLSVIGIIMTFESVNLRDIVVGQSQALLPYVPKWGVIVQPIGFLIFLTAIFAETNRLPFDLPEGESEIVAGYHTEYGAMKFALFFMAEYLNMLTGSALAATLYFGGYLLLPGMDLLISPLAGLIGNLSAVPNPEEWARVALEVLSFTLKVGFFMWFFVWVRWTLPRFRYDQLMQIGWKILLPLSLANIVVTAVLIYLKVI